METTLGKLITEPTGRDAIHVACVPMMADYALSPGQHIGIIRDGVGGGREPFVGIVDPFLKEMVLKGEWFWLVLYPQTVTKIRHHWTHPAFPDHNTAEQVRQAMAPSLLATEWITKFAAQWDYTFDDFMAAARMYVQKDYQLDDKWHQLDDIPVEDWTTFWSHFKTLTGLSVGEKEKEFVRCCPN